MIEFEMARLFSDMHSAALTQISVSMSMLSGFLVLLYFVAHRLTKLMTALLIGLYSDWNLALGTLGICLAAG